ncbi:MAG: PAS domain S-box protein, partial [Bacteroidia bacterium]|nr:PAS domain S-box protein [Bacteroidia bacterium]
MLKNKTKIELIKEVEKLQRKLSSLEKKKPSPEKPAEHLFKGHIWESFFKNSANFIVIVDKNGVILDINRIVKGLKRADVIGASAYDFVSDAERSKMQLAIKKVFKNGAPQE